MQRSNSRSASPLIRYIICVWAVWLPSFSHSVFAQQQSSEIPSALESSELGASNLKRQEALLKNMSAVSAASYGFSSIAESLFRDLLGSEYDLEPSQSDEIRYQLVLSLLNQGKTEEALAFLDGFENKNAAIAKFANLLCQYLKDGTAEDLEGLMNDIDPQELGEDVIWLRVLTGIIQMKKGDAIASRTTFDEVLNSSINDFQRSWIETIIWREEVLNGNFSESQAIALKSQIDNAVNPLIASQLTQEYAVALHGLGRVGEAITAIEIQLPQLGDEYQAQKDRLLMLLTLIAGRESGKSSVAIEEILLKGTSDRIRSMAFFYWLSGVDFSNPSEVEMLETIYESKPNDPLRNEIAYALALNSFYQGDYDRSQARIDRVLESNAGDALKQSALRVMVAVCWNQTPAKYRLAAEYLLRLRRFASDENERNRYTLLVGDSYYLNGDFENAIPYYNGVIEQTQTASDDANELLFKITDSYLKIGNVDAARPILDRFHENTSSLTEIIWGSEWNLNLHLIKLGRTDEAIERMRDLYAAQYANDDEKSEWEQLARLRVVWLLSYLHFQQADYETALTVIEQSEVLSDDGSANENSQFRRIIGEIKLLTARLQFALGDEEQAREYIAQIRQFGDPETAASSYIIEARHYLSSAGGENAQRVLLRLADQYPNSQYAPVALYEAAISVEGRADETSDQDAIALYERISTQFPDHPLNFISKLRQGNLLRKTNQFALAVSFYENMLVEYRGDERLYLCDMALGESYLAMGSSRLDYVDRAVQILERVFDLQHLPLEVRLEAGTKAAVASQKVGRQFRAQDMLWRVITLIDEDPAAGLELGASGRYWLARSMLLLSERLQAENSNQELRRLVALAEHMNLPGVNLLRSKL